MEDEVAISCLAQDMAEALGERYDAVTMPGWKQAAQNLLSFGWRHQAWLDERMDPIAKDWFAFGRLELRRDGTLRYLGRERTYSVAFGSATRANW
jgi:hypothetical protein